MFDDAFWSALLSVAIAVIALLVLVPLGLQIRTDLRTRRLVAERGLPADAEIIKIEHDDYDGEARLLLTLRFTGPGITAFDAIHRCGSVDYTVGSHLAAQVDPATNNFTVSTPH